MRGAIVITIIALSVLPVQAYQSGKGANGSKAAETSDDKSITQAAKADEVVQAQDKVYRVKLEELPSDKPQSPGIVAICALFVSVLSLGTSLYFSWAARDHNRRSVKPLPYIQQPDYENRLAVIAQNHGTGPLILRRAEATSPDGTRGHLIDLIPKPPSGKYFTTYTKVEQVRAIRPGDEVVLMEIGIDSRNKAEITYRDELRRALGQMTLTLEYTDMYGTRFETYSRTMSWFLRHFKPTPSGA